LPGFLQDARSIAQAIDLQHLRAARRHVAASPPYIPEYPFRPHMASLISQAEHQLLRPGGLATTDLDGVFTRLMGPSIDAADLYFQHSRTESWVLEDGIVKDGSHSIEQGV